MIRSFSKTQRNTKETQMKAMKVIRDNVRDVPFLLLGVVFSALASVWIFKTFCVGKESVVSNENNVLNELLPLQASSLVGYWSIALMCLGLDMMLPEEMIKMLKVQGQKNLFTTKEWFEAAGLSMLNLFVFAPMFVVPLWQYGWKDRYFEKWGNTTTISDFDLKTELFNMAIHAVVVDTVFYFTHRLIHYPYLYKRIHKIHHRFKAPVSVASMYVWCSSAKRDIIEITLVITRECQCVCI